MIQPTSKRIEDREAVLDIANQENIERTYEASIIENDHFDALIENAEYDEEIKQQQIKNAKAEAAAREKLIGPDRVMITTIANDLQTLIEKYDIPQLNTDDANELVRDMITCINISIDTLGQAGEALI